MKKLTRKLLLSVFTLAICAVTLVSTTFAWYTTNTEAYTNKVEASSTNATMDGSILISATGKGNSWSSVCTPIDNKMTTMSPLQLVGTNLIPYSNGSSDTDGAYLYFDVYFKTTRNTAEKVGDTIPVYLKDITVKNKATVCTDLTALDNLCDGRSVTTAPSKPIYRVDIVRALNLYAVADDSTVNHLDLTNLKDRNLELEKVEIAEELVSSISDEGASAIDYYNEVMGSNKTLVEPEGLKTATPMVDGKTGDNIILGYIKCESLTNGVAVYSELKVTFKIYLDGWDLYCFDACKGQTFSVDLKFTTETSDILVTKEKAQVNPEA